MDRKKFYCKKVLLHFLKDFLKWMRCLIFQSRFNIVMNCKSEKKKCFQKFFERKMDAQKITFFCKETSFRKFFYGVISFSS